MAKSWRFTLNNYLDDDVQLFQRWEPEVTRMTVSKETGESGTPHLQGFITFRRTYRLQGLKKLHPRAHWEMAIADQDCLYEMKDKSEVVINVDNRQQGKRNDIDLTLDSIRDGASVRDLWVNHTSAMVRYSRGFIQAHQILNQRSTASVHTEWRWPKITDFSKSIILVGPPGIGKTEYAKMHFSNALMVSHMDDLLRFLPGTHDGIIFDDMDFLHMPRTSQIHLVDQDNDRSLHCRYNVAFIPARTPKIFTCNELCVDSREQAVMRRVEVITLSATT